MAFFVDTETGDMTLVQGDSGKLFIQGLNTDKNYTVYFSFYNSNRRPIGNEIYVNTNQQEGIELYIPASLTNYLTVARGNETEEYYYGIKVCYDEGGGVYYEDTVCIGDKDVGELNTVTVYPKKVEGFE